MSWGLLGQIVTTWFMVSGVCLALWIYMVRRAARKKEIAERRLAQSQMLADDVLVDEEYFV